MTFWQPLRAAPMHYHFDYGSHFTRDRCRPSIWLSARQHSKISSRTKVICRLMPLRAHQHPNSSISRRLTPKAKTSMPRQHFSPGNMQWRRLTSLGALAASLPLPTALFKCGAAKSLGSLVPTAPGKRRPSACSAVCLRPPPATFAQPAQICAAPNPPPAPESAMLRRSFHFMNG